MALRTLSRCERHVRQAWRASTHLLEGREVRRHTLCVVDGVRDPQQLHEPVALLEDELSGTIRGNIDGAKGRLQPVAEAARDRQISVAAVGSERTRSRLLIAELIGHEVDKHIEVQTTQHRWMHELGCGDKELSGLEEG